MTPVSRGISFRESLLYSLHRIVDAAAICLTASMAIEYTQGTGLPDLLTVAAGKTRQPIEPMDPG